MWFFEIYIFIMLLRFIYGATEKKLLVPKDRRSQWHFVCFWHCCFFVSGAGGAGGGGGGGGGQSLMFWLTTVAEISQALGTTDTWNSDLVILSNNKYYSLSSVRVSRLNPSLNEICWENSKLISATASSLYLFNFILFFIFSFARGGTGTEPPVLKQADTWVMRDDDCYCHFAPQHSTVTLYFIIYLNFVFGCLHSTAKYFFYGLNYGIVIGRNNGIISINLTDRTIILILNQSQGLNSVTTFYKFCTTILNIQSCPARHTEEDKDRKIILYRQQFYRKTQNILTFYLSVSNACFKFICGNKYWLFLISPLIVIILSISFYGNELESI